MRLLGAAARIEYDCINYLCPVVEPPCADRLPKSATAGADAAQLASSFNLSSEARLGGVDRQVIDGARPNREIQRLDDQFEIADLRVMHLFDAVITYAHVGRGPLLTEDLAEA